MSRLKGFLKFVNTYLTYLHLRRFIKPASGILKMFSENMREVSALVPVVQCGEEGVAF